MTKRRATLTYAIHVGLRKGTEEWEANEIWRLIHKSKTGWGDAVFYAIQNLR